MDWKKLYRALSDQNWLLERTASGHIKALDPTGNHIVVMSENSDYRATKNNLAELRRRGFVWKEEEDERVPLELPLELCPSCGEHTWDAKNGNCTSDPCIPLVRSRPVPVSSAPVEPKNVSTTAMEPHGWRLVDEAGKRYGKLLVLSRGTSTNGGATRWLCKCDCGEEALVLGHSLRNGSVRSCNRCSRRGLIDETNKRYGKLLVLRRGPNSGKATKWVCKCDCGRELSIFASSLRKGMLSCGRCTSTVERFQLKDETNQRYGRLLVIRRGKNIDGRAAWICKCDCGKEVTVEGCTLRRNRKHSCGQCSQPKPVVRAAQGRKAIDESDKRYGTLTVLGRSSNTRERRASWLCQCDCGVKLTVAGDDLRKSRVLTCKRCSHVSRSGLRSRTLNGSHPKKEDLAQRELKSMQSILAELQSFDKNARQRILVWLQGAVR